MPKILVYLICSFFLGDGLLTWHNRDLMVDPWMGIIPGYGFYLLYKKHLGK